MNIYIYIYIYIYINTYMYTYINLEDLRIPLLSFSFVMTYIIDKTLVLIKNNLNYLQDNTFE